MAMGTCLSCVSARVTGCAVLAVAGVSLAHAQLAGAPLALEAENVSGVAVFELDPDDLVWNADTRTWSWELLEPTVLTDSGTGQPVALLTSGRVEYSTANRCRTTVDIGVAAGASDTSVRIISPILSFPAMSEDYASLRASASVSVTDVDLNTAYAIGEGGNGKGIYRTFYNGDRSTGVPFSDLVSFVYASNGATATGTQNDPPVGYREVGVDVGSLAVEVAFTVSRNDLAITRTYMGTSTPPACTGDIDGDRVIGLDDLTLLISSFGSCAGDPGFRERADVEMNGCVDLADLGVLLTLFATPCP